MEFERLNISNEVIQFDMIGLGDDAIVIEHSVNDYNLDDDSAATAGGKITTATQIHILHGDTVLEPYEGMKFESEADKASYNSYARRVDFTTSRVSMCRRSWRDGAIIQRSFVYAKEGFHVDKDKPLCPDGRVKPPAETCVGCKAVLIVKIQDSRKRTVSAFSREHNHELVPQHRVHCLASHRHVSGSVKSLIDTLYGAGIGPSRIMSALIKEYGGISNVGFTEHECRNYIRSSRQRTLGVTLRFSWIICITCRRTTLCFRSAHEQHLLG